MKGTFFTESNHPLTLVLNQRMSWSITPDIWNLRISGCRSKMFKKIMQWRWAVLLSILHLKFLEEKGMVNLWIGGVWDQWHTKWLLDCLHFFAKTDHNSFKRLDMRTQYSLILFLQSSKISLNFCWERNLKIDSEQREVVSKWRITLGSTDLSGKIC